MIAKATAKIDLTNARLMNASPAVMAIIKSNFRFDPIQPSTRWRLESKIICPSAESA